MMSSNSKLPIKSSSFGLCSTVFLLFFISLTQICSGEYYGKLIGKLSEIEHGVSGEVYAVDGRTLFIKDFTYDGQGPAAYFYVGSTKTPNVNGFRLRDEKGMTGPLKRYDKHGVTLTLPEGKTLNNLRWFSVYCDLYSVNFGDVKLPRGFEYPKPQKLAGLNGVHGVSSEPIVVVDSQTLLVPSFSYDGEAPDAKFWVGAGDRPSPQGVKLPDENGKINPLRRYDRKTIVLTLPGELTVQQIGHFGVWCEAFAVDFGHIKVPRGLNVPPSLNMLGVSPQSATPYLTQSSSSFYSTSSSILAEHQTQRPTTYRPPSRRDPVQIYAQKNIDTDITSRNTRRRPVNPSYPHRDVTPQPHQSYARLLRFQGDQRHDSFVHY